MKLMIATTALALMTGAAIAETSDADLDVMTKPTVAFVDAVGIATSATAGDLIALELDYVSSDAPVYIADLDSETGFARVMIDGLSGDVLASEVINAADADALDAFMENFSTHAEMAEFAAMADLFEDFSLDDDLSDEDLAELEELLEAVEDELADEIEEQITE